MSAGPGLLELLHPEGCARTALILDAPCPQSWLPAPQNPVSAPVELVVLGPAVEGRKLRDAAESLSANGVLLVFAAPGQRRRVATQLRQCGVELTGALLYRQIAADWQRLVSLELAALRRVTQRALPPGTHRLLWWWHPDVLLVGRRRGARPCSEWLLPDGGADPEPRLSLQIKRRGARWSIVMELLDGQARLLGVAKIGLEGRAASERVIRETELVTSLGPGVRASGARLPDARVIRLPSGCPVMVQTPIEGRPMDTLLARGRLAFGAFAERLTNWLERWNGATRTVQVIDRAWLDREVLVPAARVALRLTGGGPYLESLRARCAAVEGEALPLVAAHCDLTVSNLLDTPGGELGVIDWEASQDAGLPLRDLVYCLVDAAWVAGGRGSRSQSFGDCFEPGGKFRAVIRHNQERLCRSLGLSEMLAALCFHACWVQHAADEVAEGTAMEPGPFLRIVERLAREPFPFSQAAGVDSADR